MKAFDYHRPTSLADAVRLLADDPEAKALAGGMTLIPTLKQRLAMPTSLVDLGRIDGLSGIAREGDIVAIGATTTHAAVAGSDIVQAAIPALAELAGKIGDPQVRNCGTIGGSVANNDPAADYPAGLLGLGATVVTDRRSLPADDFFKGLFETALAPDELIRQVRFPIPLAAGYAKFPNPASRYAVVGVFVARFAGQVRVAVTGAGPGVFRIPAMEAALGRSFSAEAIAGISIAPDALNADPHATSEYRAHLIGVMARRAIESAQ